MKMSYMVGFGNKFPQQVHHRGASIPSIKAHPAKVGCNQGYSNWYNNNNPNPNVHVGAIVGGPDANDGFKDVRSDHTHLEPTTYLNAAGLGLLADMLSGTHAAESSKLSFMWKVINETFELANIM
ncbi:hypothetical protein SOVF_006230 [Spinacia oleracea]|nr:hypothetical protein SOVF_006230 [Spinacia oleracea]